MKSVVERLQANIAKRAGIRLSAEEALQLWSLLRGLEDHPFNAVAAKIEWPKPLPPDSQMQVHIRWMIRRDMPSVMAIGEHGLRWDEDTFIRHLRHRDTIGMVAEWQDQVVGQMICELHKNRLHIVNFGVDPEYQRRTVASQMIQKLQGKLSEQRRNRIVLDVPESMLGMQLFLKSCGFRADGVNEDEYRFVLRHVAEVSP